MTKPSMWQRAFRFRRDRRDSGAYLAIVAATLFIFLAVAGLAVDSARIYWTRAELQRAVDAAAIATARLMARDSSVNYTNASQYAQQLLQEDLELSKIPQNERALTQTKICFNDATTTVGCSSSQPAGSSLDRRYVYAEATLDRPTLILGWIPGFAKSAHVAVRALAENLQFQVVLVLDTSGSMADSYGAHSKIYYLHQGAKQLIDALLPFDKIGLVKFSYWGGDSATMNGSVPLDTNANWTTLENNYRDDAVKVYPAVGVPLPFLGAPGGQIETDLKNNIDSIAPDSYTNIGAGIRLGREVLQAEGPPPTNTLRLLVVVTDGAPTQYKPVSWPTSPTTSGSAGLHNLHHPGSCNLPGLLNPTTDQNRLRQLDAIWEADKARIEEDTMVVTLGLGVEDANTDSPFQAVGDGSLLKRILLERVANDQSAMLRTNPPPNWTSPAPVPPYIWDFPCVETGQTMKQYKKGMYLFANSGQQLIDNFKTIGELRTRLAQ